MNQTSVHNSDPAELLKFGSRAHAFWDRDGAFRTLHDIDPARQAYIAARAGVAGARVADIGCGGGLLAEGLARRGATVMAIDLAPEMIEVARLHAAGAALAIDYRLCSAEQLVQERPHAFDVVCCMEMIEHVPDPARLIQQLAALTRPGGTVLLSTINRTAKAFAAAIVAAEYLFGLVERGTHEYARLVRPSELAAHARAAGLELLDVTGIGYNPLTRRASLGGRPDVNYLAQLLAPAAAST
jgi:2-polyprenyl-6-hydroxyphenyl methylase / 3-demethylubiquinone-9 3-methyltransferase